jgi:hypothetical protein
MNRVLDMSNSLWMGSKNNNFFEYFFKKKINGTNISYIMSYMTYKTRHYDQWVLDFKKLETESCSTFIMTNYDDV